MRSLFPIVLLALVCACTPYVYGVPQPTWETLSEAERLETMRLYSERQIAYQQAAAERARLRALELERQRQREAEEARLFELRLAAIYRGEGAYGELVRIRLQGGWIRLNGQHYSYAPVTFLIADHEHKTIVIVDKRGHKEHLSVYYSDGNLYLDGNDASHTRHAVLLGQHPDWHDGRLYSGLKSQGKLALKDVTAYVEVVRDQHGTRYPGNARPPGRWSKVEKQEPTNHRHEAQQTETRTQEKRGGFLQSLEQELAKKANRNAEQAQGNWSSSERGEDVTAYKRKSDDTRSGKETPEKSTSDKDKPKKVKTDKSKSDKDKDTGKNDKSRSADDDEDNSDEERSERGNGKKLGHEKDR